ncbi:hypothetical protein DPEC_G00188010 [Dallia pectoralis]|uniref:Uncharacterized protein n=1 Tax=Dallia pectoralis TaxID=75939 RepID=A0ACC2GBZ2_DALPE|nr:hypothetical protein DPEC_G00188010 [Dallia pectoralis]
MGWLFINSLMARFNMKGKRTRGKTALEKTKVYIAIQDGVMTCDAADRGHHKDACCRAPEAPQRSGVGGDPQD